MRALQVLSQAPGFVAVDKPAGAVVIPARVAGSERSIREMLEEQLGRRLFVVHRLDRDTSGVVLFALSAAALSDNVRRVATLAARMEELLEEQTPLVAGGFEVVPSTSNRFRRDERVGLYTEVFEPMPIAKNFLRVGVLFNIIDRKTNQSVFASNTILVNDLATEGNPIIPVLIQVPITNLPAGEYRLEMRARDSQGQASPVRHADFVLD